jgi:hypothetical protein
VLLPAICGACHSSDTAASVRVIDLLRHLDQAERYPAAGTFEIAERTAGGITETTLEVTAPSRLIWTLRFPERAVFRARVGSPAQLPGSEVTFRIGVSDDRIYERLVQETITSTRSGWIPVLADLSSYAGWKWSLFYRPDSHPWRLVLSVDTNRPQTRAWWAAPGIDADRAAAHDFAQQK